ncbi:GntR family transcriptional regulator [Pseudohalocynthiibacter aestuariivivens]|uniref:GntR family transcriptional regulator n=1 Tax=Roseovarius pelagicus TaxID=2980108 RepID=A0ABY6DF51_9RHOB|nr:MULTISPECIES: GntR family transcriptional regulator [Rhodobacterales]QIE46690.1 GntR family transcriptional regulator [Pseudohalocynthiibacter aestuariivivens]UXX84777.1 GntR family transcriptional regulator [Roseovarius pelagicus]
MQNRIFTRKARDRSALYLQIAGGLRRNILQGIYAPNEKLPAISKLAKEFDVSIVTVRNAVAVLEAEGLVERRQGSGTYVKSNEASTRSLHFDTSFRSLLDHLKGRRAKVLVASDEPLTPLIHPKIGKLCGPYHFMRRIHMTDTTPYAVINIHLRKDIYLQNREGYDREMVIPLLAKSPEIAGGRMHQTISFTTADPETAEHLDLPVNAAIGDVKRVITDAQGAVLYVGNTKYRGDFVNLEIDITIDEEFQK